MGNNIEEEKERVRNEYEKLFKKEVVIKNSEIYHLVSVSVEDKVDYLEAYEE